MGFRQGAYARIWKIEDNGNYSVAQISVSRKNKETGKYDIEFQDGFIRLVGNAHETAKKIQLTDKGVPIQITSCDVTNKYDGEKKKTYVNFTVFGFDIVDGNSTGETNKSTAKSGKPAPAANADSDEEDLPF